MIATLITEDGVDLEETAIDPDHQVHDHATNEILMGATVMCPEVDAVEDVIATPEDGRAAALPPFLVHLGQALAAAAHLAALTDPSAVTARNDEGHQEVEKPSERGQGRQRGMSTVLAKIVRPEGADTPRIRNLVPRHRISVRLWQRGGDILRLEADPLIAVGDIRGVCRHRGPGVLPGPVAVAVLHRPRSMAKGRKAAEATSRIWMMTVLGGDGLAQADMPNVQQRDANLLLTDEETVHHLRHPLEREPNPLMFLKMNHTNPQPKLTRNNGGINRWV